MKKYLSVLLAILFTFSIFFPAKQAQAKDELKNTDPDKYYIVLDLTNQVITVYEKDEAGEYTRIVRRMLCTTGADDTPTPTGTYRLGAKEHFGKFANFNTGFKFGIHHTITITEHILNSFE